MCSLSALGSISQESATPEHTLAGERTLAADTAVNLHWTVPVTR